MDANAPKLVRKELYRFNPCEIPMSLSEAAKWFKDMAEEYGAGYVKVELDFDKNYFYDYDRYPTPTFFVYGHRHETDAEVYIRVSSENKIRQLREDEERQRYLELSKKFGN
jgi:hypothetical protein